MAELWSLLHFVMPALFDSHDEFKVSANNVHLLRLLYSCFRAGKAHSGCWISGEYKHMKGKRIMILAKKSSGLKKNSNCASVIRMVQISSVYNAMLDTQFCWTFFRAQVFEHPVTKCRAFDYVWCRNAIWISIVFVVIVSSDMLSKQSYEKLRSFSITFLFPFLLTSSYSMAATPAACCRICSSC